MGIAPAAHAAISVSNVPSGRSHRLLRSHINVARILERIASSQDRDSFSESHQMGNAPAGKSEQACLFHLPIVMPDT